MFNKYYLLTYLLTYPSIATFFRCF